MYITPNTLNNARIYLHKQRGFSLIEVLVSLSIFTVVVTIAVGSLMVLITANSRAQHSQAVLTNITYMLDSMTREIRTGTSYYCGSTDNELPTADKSPTTKKVTNDCKNENYFAFNEGGESLTANAGSRRIGYKLEKVNGKGVVMRRLGSNGGWLPVTSSDIDITTLNFIVTGSTQGDSQTPTVTVYVDGVTDKDKETESSFNVQTTVVQQILDI